MKIWAKIKNSQQWENPNVCYRNILRVKRLKYCVSWDFKYLITYLVVPRFSRSCDSHLDLAIVHLIEVFHIGDRIHLEIFKYENPKFKDKMSRLLVKLWILKLWSFVNKTLFWIKRKVNLQFTQPLKHFLKIHFGRASARELNTTWKILQEVLFHFTDFHSQWWHRSI